MQRLISDLKADLPWVQGRKLSSIFFGGGTPSLFSGSAIGEILNAAEQLIGFESDIEITLEANPGTFEQQKFADFHSAGVNRLSIGCRALTISICSDWVESMMALSLWKPLQQPVAPGLIILILT